MTAYPYRLPRKYRYRSRRHGKSTGREKVIGLAVGAVLIAAVAHKPAAISHGVHVAGAAISGSIPGGSDLDTPSEWAVALLAADGLPQTSCNYNAVTAWERAEGGGFGNQAEYNPLNVNPGAGAGWPGYPATGAWAFPDAATGLRYTVATLNNGDYGAILAALRAGDSAQAVCDAIMASPWAASHYDGALTATC